MGVPFGNYNGRGLNLPVSLTYSSNVWSIEHFGTVQTTIPGYSGWVNQSVTEAIYAKNSTAGWKSSLGLPLIEFPKASTAYNYKGKAVSYPAAGCFQFRIPEVYIHLPDGSTHMLRKSDLPYSASSVDKNGTFYAIDGSRIRFDSTDSANGAGTRTIYMPDGMKYVLGATTSYFYFVRLKISRK